MIPIGTTRLTCLLGDPVSHSISPKMHNTAFEALGLDFSYLAFKISENEIEKAVEALKLLNCRGFNLTMPLKHCIIPLLDEISEASRLSNAVNTVVIENGKLIGHTTDGIGFIDALKDYDFEVSQKTITMLGAGGAAQSIITQAAIDGAKQIYIFKRKNASFDNVVSYAQNVSAATKCKIDVIDMHDSAMLKECLSNSDLLINGTNVGMGDDNTSLVPKEYFHKNLFVADVIYHPAKTKLLCEAEEAGCKIMNGKYMLLYQGAAAFKIWTGQDMPIDLIKNECFKEEI